MTLLTKACSKSFATTRAKPAFAISNARSDRAAASSRASFVSESVAEDFKDVVDAERVREMLGPIKFRQQAIAAESEIGLATGLAWTEIGGEVLQIEATLVKGRGGVTLTGKLGDVMQESAQAALTCIKARAERLAMSIDFIRKRDLHIHIPEGAIPKDGPSAGITMATAMASALTRVAVQEGTWR